MGDPLNGGFREYYIRDAQGNIMATYKYTNSGSAGASLMLTERPIYGSSRIGSHTQEMEMIGSTPPQYYPYTQPMPAPKKRYELTDHLGNVSTVVTGKLLPMAGGGYQAEVVSAQSYEPFGSLLPGRHYSSDAYRFGFNGKENDNEWHGAVGTMQDYGMRAYDTRVGRFFAVDPITDEYPELTPYQFASLKPIWLVDIDGLEGGMLKRRPKPLLSNRFNGKGLIPWLGGSRGKYFRHSVLDMPSLLGRRKGNDRSNGNAGNPTDYAADPSRNAPDRDGRNDRDNNGGRIGLGRITPANISTDGVPIQLKPNKDNGTFDLEFDPGTYEDGTPASKSFEIGIMDAHGNVRGVQTTGPVSTPGTLNLDFDLKPGETLYYKTTATDPQRSSDGGIRGSARQREASDED